MSFGIGLGAFMDGMEGGMRMREQIDSSRQRRDNKARLDEIDTDARKAFDTQVEQGAATPEQFDKFWMDYALPRRRNEMLRQGDLAGAKALDEWGKSDEVRQGGRLFASALLKAQTGDPAGALQDAIRAGEVKGYIEHGYELMGQDEIQDAQGNTVGYRLRVKGPDGREIEQDVATGDVARVVSTFANPEAAWESQVAARNAQRERGEKLEDFESQEEIRARHRGQSTPDYEERYRKAREDLAKNNLDFSDMSPQEQDAMVRDVLDQAESYGRERTGQGGRPGQRGGGGEQVIVDSQTGQPVRPGQEELGEDPALAAPGLGSDPATEAEQTRASGGGIGGFFRDAMRRGGENLAKDPWRKPEGAGPSTAETGPNARRAAPDHDSIVNQAASEIGRGGDPQSIARRLQQAGVSPSAWPAELRGMLNQRAPGLGGGGGR